MSQSLYLIRTTLLSGHYTSLFSSPDTLATLINTIIIPNVILRLTDVEQFTDDPLEFIRLSLFDGTTGGVGNGTRRGAAADVLRALVSVGGGATGGVSAEGAEMEKTTTALVGEWIGRGLSEYEAERSRLAASGATGEDRWGDAWKGKDAAIYLLTAVASRGGTAKVYFIVFSDFPRGLT